MPKSSALSLLEGILSASSSFSAESSSESNPELRSGSSVLNSVSSLSAVFGNSSISLVKSVSVSS